ncbi:hypothetical protein IGI37_001801 [Enterococcus sp. AZ194]
MRLKWLKSLLKKAPVSRIDPYEVDNEFMLVKDFPNTDKK